MPGWGEIEEEDEEDENVDASGDSETINLTELISDLDKLDQHLSDKSYIEGFDASLADLAVFINIKSEIDDQFVNVKRWYNHIESLKEELEEQRENLKSAYAQASEEQKEMSSSDESSDEQD